MARDWANEVKTMAALQDRLRTLAPTNSAPIPISMNQELDDLGRMVWVVDIHVRVRGVTEFDVTGTAPEYTEAIRRAFLGLRNEPLLRAQSNLADRRFGLTP